MITKEFPILYSRTAKGAVNTWQIWAEGPIVICKWGKLDGKQQIAKYEAEPKNVGRSNATTAEEQAVSEAESKWTEQLRKKYSETLEEAETSQAVTPMLAQDWKKQKSKLQYPNVYGQPKLDGLRALTYLKDGKPVLHSRGNKFYSLPHLEKELTAILKPSMVLDGELYRHGISLQTINSLVRAPKKDSEKVQYHLYDLVNNDPFSERTKELHRIVKSSPSDSIVLVETGILSSEELVMQYQAECVEAGFEGCMVRSGAGKYRYGYRSPDLLKCKTFQDNEFRIVGYQTGKGKYENIPTFRCVTEAGKEFNVTPKGSQEERLELLQQAERLIGHWLTVKYFDLSPDEQVPLFPVGVSVRLEEDLP